MALEARRYQRQRGDARLTPTPIADANAFGSDVGRAISQLGDTVHRNEVNAYKIERQQQADQETADFNARFAAARERMDRVSIDARNNAAPGAAGHADAVAKAWDDERAQLLTGMTETRLIQHAEQQLGEFGSRLRSSEYQFEQGARIGKTVADFQQTSDLSANRARLAHDPASFAEELKFGRAGIEAMAGVPADVKDKLVREHEQRVSIGYLNGLNDSNPAIALAMLNAGTFNDILDPAQIEQARNGAQVEVRRADAQVAHQQQLQKQALQDEVETVKAQMSGGVIIPDARLAELQGRLSAMGDEGGATKIGIARVEAGVRKVADVWRPEQFDDRINVLAGKQKRSAHEDIELKTLRGMRGPATETFNRNPGEWAAKNNMPPPALDLGDPQSIAARKSWARTVSGVARRPVPLLTANEAADLRARAGESPKARLAVVDQIAAMGDYRSITSVARQIAPNDAMLARLATLPRDIRTASVAGAEVRQGNRTLIDGVAGTEAREAFDTRLGAAAQLMNPADLNAAFDTARNLYAFSTRDGAQAYEEGKFAPFIHQALGGTLGPRGERLGGVGRVNGAPMLLTPNMTQDRFDRAWSRFTFRQSDRTPVWQDGRAMTPVEVKRYQPTLRPDGRYEFHGPNNQILKVKSGGIWTVDFERFAQDVGL